VEVSKATPNINCLDFGMMVYDVRKMKHSAEYRKFTGLVDRLLTVSHEEMQQREAEYRRQVDANPKRRGPKRRSERKAKQAISLRE
jgi:hypothetical protein